MIIKNTSQVKEQIKKAKHTVPNNSLKRIKDNQLYKKLQ